MTLYWLPPRGEFKQWGFTYQDQGTLVLEHVAGVGEIRYDGMWKDGEPVESTGFVVHFAGRELVVYCNNAEAERSRLLEALAGLTPKT